MLSGSAFQAIGPLKTFYAYNRAHPYTPLNDRRNAAMSTGVYAYAAAAATATTRPPVEDAVWRHVFH